MEDPATVVRASNQAELEVLLRAGIPPDWRLSFAFILSVVVGDEAILTYQSTLTTGTNPPAQLLINSTFVSTTRERSTACECLRKPSASTLSPELKSPPGTFPVAAQLAGKVTNMSASVAIDAVPEFPDWCLHTGEEPKPETSLHYFCSLRIVSAIRWVFRDRSDVFVAANFAWFAALTIPETLMFWWHLVGPTQHGQVGTTTARKVSRLLSCLK